MIIAPPQHWEHLPGISVLCPTYGRINRLPGLVQSFLQQDYQGPSELIILNDRHDQIIGLAPDSAVQGKVVTVLNVSVQFPTLSQKRNRLVELATFPYVAWWDDDDRFLPGRLTRGMQLMRVGFRGSHEPRIWVNDGKGLALSSPTTPFASAITERQAIVDAGGFAGQTEYDEDIALMRALIHKLRAFPSETDMRCPTTIYRKPGTSGHSHLGESGKPSSTAEARAYMQGSVDARVSNGQEPTGTILITPKWGVDYSAMVAAAWAARGGT